MKAWQRKKRQKISKGNLFVLMIIMIVVIFMVLLLIRETGNGGLTIKRGDPRPLVLNQEDFLSEEGIQSKNALLIRLQDHRVLLDLNGEEEVYPASMTKIMTALVAIENISDLNVKIRLDPNLFDSLYERNASLAGFAPGEEATAEDLLYGCLLPSGAEASASLAVYTAGSPKAFVDMMNQKAAALGMKHTHFCNVTGLHDPDHYTTMQDMALLLEYALQNKTFRQAFTTAKYTVAPTDRNPKGLTFYSTLLARKETAVEFPGGIILGGKTGYTGEAGLCLASLAEKNGSEYILITAGAQGKPGEEPLHIRDALKIYGVYLLR